MTNNNTIWIIIALLISVLFIMPFGGRWGGFCGVMGASTGPGLMLLVWVILIALIVLLINQMQGNNRRRK